MSVMNADLSGTFDPIQSSPDWAVVNNRNTVHVKLAGGMIDMLQEPSNGHTNLLYVPASDMTGDCTVSTSSYVVSGGGAFPAFLKQGGGGVCLRITGASGKGERRVTLWTLNSGGGFSEKFQAQFDNVPVIQRVAELALVRQGNTYIGYVDGVEYVRASKSLPGTTPGLMCNSHHTEHIYATAFSATGDAVAVPIPGPTPEPVPEPEPMVVTTVPAPEPALTMRHQKCVYSHDFDSFTGAFGQWSDAGTGHPDMLATSGGSKYWKVSDKLGLQALANGSGDHWDYYAIGRAVSNKVPDDFLTAAGLPLNDWAVEVDVQLSTTNSYLAPALMSSLEWSNSQGGADVGGFGRCVIIKSFHTENGLKSKLRWVVNNAHDEANIGGSSWTQPSNKGTFRLAISPNAAAGSYNVKVYFNGVFLTELNDSALMKQFPRMYPGLVGAAGKKFATTRMGWVGGIRVYVEDSVAMPEVANPVTNVGPDAPAGTTPVPTPIPIPVPIPTPTPVPTPIPQPTPTPVPAPATDIESVVATLRVLRVKSITLFDE